MKLLGKDISGQRLLQSIEERLRARGLVPEVPDPVREDSVEGRVDPLSFNLSALEEHADSTRPLPLQTHRTGAGRVVLYAKWAFRLGCQVFINETLSRQTLFNGHVRDSYAQLSAEVIALRKEVEVLRAQRGQRPAGKKK
jgi:hypothetical protein